MFENLSTRTVILMGATVLGIAATAVSAIKDHRDNAACCCIEECCEEAACELTDPTVEA